MSDLRSRVAYLKGLSEGLELEAAGKEGRVLSEVLNVVGEMADKMATLASEQEDLEAYVDVLDADLQDLEEELSDETEDEAEDEADVEPRGRVLSFERLEAPSAQRASGPEVPEDEPGSLSCPHCGGTLGSTEPDAVTYAEPEDELRSQPEEPKV